MKYCNPITKRAEIFQLLSQEDICNPAGNFPDLVKMNNNILARIYY